MKKRILAVLCVMTLTLSLLTACGSSQQDSSTQTDAGDSSASTPVETLDYPKKNITVIVPYGAGGTTDLTTRTLLDNVDLPSGVNFVVENIAGGSGLIGTEQAMTAKTDGYTLLAVTGDILLSRAMGATDIDAEASFIPLVCSQYDPYYLITKNNSDFDTLEKFVDNVKKGGDSVTVAITGVGTPGGLACMALQDYFGCSIKTVTYDSSANCVVAVTSGEVDSTFQPCTAAIGQVEAGELAIIAATSAERSSVLPDVPTIAETYEEAADLNLNSVIFICALEGTDPAIVDYLREAMDAAIDTAEYEEAVTTSFMMAPAPMSVDEKEAYWPDIYEFYASYLSE